MNKNRMEIKDNRTKRNPLSGATFCDFLSEAIFLSASQLKLIRISHQPIKGIDFANAIKISFRIIIQGEEIFWIMVMDALKRTKFSCKGIFISNSGRYPKVGGSPCVCSHKVYFKIVNFSYIDIISSSQQFKVDDIFQNVPVIHVSGTSTVFVSILRPTEVMVSVIFFRSEISFTTMVLKTPSRYS